MIDLTPKRASGLGLLSYSGKGISAAKQGSSYASCYYFDCLPAVLPNKHRIVSLAHLRLSSSVPGSMLTIGGQFSGLFLCPSGTPAPLQYGGVRSFPFRAPSVTDGLDLARMQTTPASPGPGIYSSVDIGSTSVPGQFPVNISDDEVGDGASLFFRDFILPSNWFLRCAAVANNTEGITNVSGISFQLSLQYVDEDNC